MTSLYQVALRGKVVETLTPKNKKERRWFYIGIVKAVDPSVDREETIVSVPKDKKTLEDFGRRVVLDLSTRQQKFGALMYPISMVFQWDDSQKEFIEHSMKKGDFTEKWNVIRKSRKTFSITSSGIRSPSSRWALEHLKRLYVSCSRR